MMAQACQLCDFGCCPFHSLRFHCLKCSQTGKNQNAFFDEKVLYVFYGHPCASGGVVAQLVERATPGEEVPGSIPAVAARSLLVGSVSV